MDVVRLEEYYKRLFPISSLLKWLGFGPSEGMTLRFTSTYQKPYISLSQSISKNNVRSFNDASSVSLFRTISTLDINRTTT